MPRADADFGRGYRQATCALIGVPSDVLWTEPDLLARVQRARAAADVWGTPDDRLRVENEYAKALFADGEVEVQHAVLLDAGPRFAMARRFSVETLELLVDNAMRTNRLEDGLVLADQCESLLAELLDEERNPSSAIWLDFHLLVRVRVLGDRARILSLLGLPDLTARVLIAEHEAARAMSGLPSAQDAEFRVGLDQILLDMARLDFEGAFTACDALLASTGDIYPEARMACLGYKALAMSWLAREGRSDVQREATDLLRSLLSDNSLRADIRDELLLALVSLELREREFETAEAHLKEAQTILVGSELERDPIHAEEKREMAAAYAARLALERGDPQAELRARRADLDRACTAMFVRQSKMPLRRGGVGFLHWANPRIPISESIRCSLALDGPLAGAEQGIELVAAAHAQGTIARSLHIPAVSLAEIRSHLLEPDHGLLLYLPSCDRTHLFVVDDVTQRAFELDPRGMLLSAIAPFSTRASMPPEPSDRAHASSAHEDPLREMGDDLRRRLLPDEALLLMQRWKGFYVVGLDLLSQVNFERLPLPTGRTMGVEYAVCHLPSLPFGVWMANRASSRSENQRRSKLMVFVPTGSSTSTTELGSKLAPVVLTRADHDALASARGAGACVFLEGKAASRTKLSSDALASVQVLQIFTHGAFDPERERSAGLALDPEDGDGVLWCEDVEAGLVSPPVVALFACGSGFGPVRLGDDGSSQLGVSFLRQEADSVIVGRAALALGAMVELGQELDRGLSSAGMPRAEALRRARQKLAESRAWNDPFYFANVSMIGLGWDDASRSRATSHSTVSERPEGSGSPRWLWLLACGSLVGSVILVVASRARQKRAGPVADERHEA
jgi:hypothetical protein